MPRLKRTLEKAHFSRHIIDDQCLVYLILVIIVISVYDHNKQDCFWITKIEYCIPPATFESITKQYAQSIGAKNHSLTS